MPSRAIAARTYSVRPSCANSGVCTPTRTKPRPRYFAYHCFMYGNTLRQFSQPAVHISTPTTLPRSEAIPRGRPSVLNHGPPPLRSGADAPASARGVDMNNPDSSASSTRGSRAKPAAVRVTSKRRIAFLRDFRCRARSSVRRSCKLMIKHRSSEEGARPVTFPTRREPGGAPLKQPVDDHRGEEQAEIQDGVAEERHFQSRPADGQHGPREPDEDGIERGGRDGVDGTKSVQRNVQRQRRRGENKRV